MGGAPRWKPDGRRLTEGRQPSVDRASVSGHRDVRGDTEGLAETLRTSRSHHHARNISRFVQHHRPRRVGVERRQPGRRRGAIHCCVRTVGGLQPRGPEVLSQRGARPNIADARVRHQGPPPGLGPRQVVRCRQRSSRIEPVRDVLPAWSAEPPVPCPEPVGERPGPGHEITLTIAVEDDRAPTKARVGQSGEVLRGSGGPHHAFGVPHLEVGGDVAHHGVDLHGEDSLARPVAHGLPETLDELDVGGVDQGGTRQRNRRLPCLVDREVIAQHQVPDPGRAKGGGGSRSRPAAGSCPRG